MNMDVNPAMDPDRRTSMVAVILQRSFGLKP